MKYFFDDNKRSLLDEESGFNLDVGQKTRSQVTQGLIINEYKVDNSAKESAPFLSGDYIIAQTNLAFDENVRQVLGKKFKKLINKDGAGKKKILCCGIGNPYMVSDSLGAETIRKLMEKRKKKIKLLMPLLEGLTGISSMSILKNVVIDERIDTVIMIDSLCTRKNERIGFSYQLSNAGIIPGSAMGATKSVDKEFLGVKTFAIGVPTVLKIDGIEGGRENMFAPKDIDLIIEKVSRNICEIIENAIY